MNDTIKQTLPVKRLLTVLGISLLTGCASTALDDVAKNRTQDMKAIYDAQMSKTTAVKLQQAKLELPPSIATPSTIKANDEMPAFYRLDNPEITLWVMPNLISQHAIPTPGYKTHFQLYEKNEYALLGELQAKF